MISHAQGSCVRNTKIHTDDLEKFGIAATLLRELTLLIASPAPAQADVGELSFFHVKRRVHNAKSSSPDPKNEEACPCDETVAI